jgi:SpoVK/Ycf46/Vps4 family AAA+-type ATPase
MLSRNNRSQRRTKGLRVSKYIKSSFEIDEAIKELNKLNNSEKNVINKFTKENPDLKKSIEDLIIELQLDSKKSQEKEETKQEKILNFENSTQNVPPAINRLIKNQKRAQANNDSKQYEIDKNAEINLRKIWQNQIHFQKTNSLTAHSVPDTGAFLNAIAEKLLQADLKSAGTILLSVATASCRENETVDDTFQCVLREKGEKIHATFVKLFRMFEDLGGVEGGFFVAPANNVNSNYSNVGSSNNAVVGGNNSNNNQSSSNQSNEENLFKNAILSVKSNTRFGDADLVGAVVECQEITEKLILPQIWTKLLTKQSTTLLYGPPGTGKTQIAKGILNLFKDELPENSFVELFTATGATLKGKYVGQTEKQITWTYDEIQRRAANALTNDKNVKTAMSILFLDEIEALAQSRTQTNDSSSSSTVTTLLQVLAGVDDKYNNVVTLAATNLPWQLDSAISRRFTTKIFVDLPGDKDRFKIIKKTMIKRLIHFSTIGLVLKQRVNDGENLNEAEQNILHEAAKTFEKEKEELSSSGWLDIFCFLLMFATGFRLEARGFLEKEFVRQGITINSATSEVDNFLRRRDHINPFEYYTIKLPEERTKNANFDRNFQTDDSEFPYSFTELRDIIISDKIELNDAERTEFDERLKQLEKEQKEQIKIDDIAPPLVSDGQKDGGDDISFNDDAQENTENKKDYSKLISDQKKNGDVKLSTPRYTFGFTTAELVLLVNDSLNAFALMILKEIKTEKKSCTYHCPTCRNSKQRCNICQDIEQSEITLSLSRLYESKKVGERTTKKFPSQEFSRIVIETMNKKTPATNDNEYMKMVFFDSFGKLNLV